MILRYLVFDAEGWLILDTQDRHEVDQVIDARNASAPQGGELLNVFPDGSSVFNLLDFTYTVVDYTMMRAIKSSQWVSFGGCYHAQLLGSMAFHGLN